MVSWVREFVATGERVDALGPDPVGYIAYHSDGRMMTLEVRKDRAKPKGLVPTDEEKLVLFDSMLAYAGTYTLDDEKVVHHVDISWNQTWTGTDQVRFYRVDGDTLTISSAPAPDPYTGQEVVHRVVFRKLPNSN
jgi:hypothetical protein